jgi:L-lactate dehydrogenase (cytochrome)
MGFASLTAYRGELVIARAAARASIPMILSGATLIRLEDVIKEAAGAWFQAYVPGQADWFLPLLDRVERAGFETLVLTVDMAVVANRENNVRNGFSAPLRPSLRLAWDGLVRPRWTVKTFLRTLALHGIPHFENMSADRGVPIVARDIVRRTSAREDLDWVSFDMIRKRWRGRLIVKGIMTAADARIARERGADGIVVSNHGGRQLDGTPSPLRVLPEIADTIAGAIPVMMDSGIRRGGDVLKALALGADFVFVGRPFMFAAAIAGEAGVAHAHRLLAEEVDRDMALLGIKTLAEMTPDRLMRVAGVPGSIRGFGSDGSERGQPPCTHAGGPTQRSRQGV